MTVERFNLIHRSEKNLIKSEDGMLKFSSKGAHIEELTLNDVLLLTSVERGDKPGEKKATHPCTPIFGSEGKQSRTSYDIATQHGQARKEVWQVLNVEEDEITVQHQIQDGKYPRGIDVLQTTMLKDGKFVLITKHSNEGVEPAPINFAEHFYFNTPFGWQGTLINNVDITDLITDDTPHPQVIELNTTNLIVIPGLPPFYLEQFGLPHAVLWVGNDNTGKKDDHYLTIEPCEGNPFEFFFGSEKSMLPPGLSRQTSLAIHF